jgi:hypothetical protein
VPQTDDALLCPACGYNLTGLTESRCPECGNGFDRAQLLRARDEGAPVLYDRRGQPHTRFFTVFFAALFTPGRLARALPLRPGHAHGWRHSLLCYTLAATVVLVADLGFVVPFSGLWPIFLGAVVGALGTCMLCESVLAIVLAAMVPPTATADPYRFWRGALHYTSGYTLLTALWGIGIALRPWGGRGWPEPWPQIALATPVFAWWVAALSVIVCQRGAPGWSARVAAVVEIVIFGVAACAAGFGAAFVGGLIGSGFCR